MRFYTDKILDCELRNEATIGSSEIQCKIKQYQLNYCRE